MTLDAPQKAWIPVCCGRVMRFNRFLKQDGDAYGSMMCTVCNKSVTLEQETVASAEAFGEGTRLLTVIGTPKPPKTDRSKASNPVSGIGSDDQTL
ncbi:MAG TPA: hypothetical protein VMT51_02830 [Dongiaceae bacterium]|nr:hypothetical protein [Dongiaceae bacterium]